MKKIFSQPYMFALWALIVISAPMIGLSIFGAANTTMSALYVGLPFIAGYLGVYFLIMGRGGHWPKPWISWVIAAVLWGAGPVMLLVNISGEGITQLPQKLGLDIFTASLGGAWPEELGKGVGVLFILLAYTQMNNKWHGFIVGSFIGLGFTIIENLGYGASAGILDPVSDPHGVTHIWTIRTIAGPTQHAVYTALAGYGIAMALYATTKSLSWRIGRAAAWVGLGFFCHFLWNTSPQSETINYITMGVAALIGYGTFITLVVRMYREKRAKVTTSV